MHWRRGEGRGGRGTPGGGGQGQGELGCGVVVGFCFFSSNCFLPRPPHQPLAPAPRFLRAPRKKDESGEAHEKAKGRGGRSRPQRHGAPLAPAVTTLPGLTSRRLFICLRKKPRVSPPDGRTDGGTGAEGPRDGQELATQRDTRGGCLVPGGRATQGPGVCPP